MQEKTMTPVGVWHYHHATYLVEFPTETIESRHAFIDNEKDPPERSLRHQLLKEVVGDLPAALGQAYQALEQANQAWEQVSRAWKQTYQLDRPWQQAGQALEQASRAWKQTYRDNLSAIEALHKLECPDCPWDGETIFGQGK